MTRILHLLVLVVLSILTIMPFQTAYSATCSGVTFDPYMEDDHLTVEETIEIIGMIENISTASSGAEDLIRIMLAAKSSPDNGVWISGYGTVNDIFGAFAAGLVAGSEFAQGNAAKGTLIIAKKVLNEVINSTSVGKAIYSPVINIANLAALPIEITLKIFQERVEEIAYNNQVKLYLYARQLGVTHEQILNRNVPDTQAIVLFTDDGWLYLVEELSLTGYKAVRPGDLTPAVVFNEASIYFQNISSTFKEDSCDAFLHLAKVIADELRLEISSTPQGNSFSGPAEITYSVSGGLIDQVGITSTHWSFTDDSESIELSPVRVYRTPGAYTANVVVTLLDGQVFNLSKSITIFPPKINVGYPNGYQSNTRSFSTPDNVYVESLSWQIDSEADVSSSSSFEYDFVELEHHTVTLKSTLDTGQIIETSRNIYLGSGDVLVRQSTVQGEETWGGGRTYILERWLTIPTGATLIIEPGAIIKFRDNISLIVRGTLIADGVEFRSASEGGTWRGIAFYQSSSDSSRLENCVVRDAENARNPSDPLRDTYASIYIDGASPTIRNCELTSGNAAPRYGIKLVDSGAKIVNNRFSDFRMPDGGTIQSRAISHAYKPPVGVGGLLVDGNTFTNNDEAVYVQYVYSKITNNVFNNNNYGIIASFYASNGRSPHIITGNSFSATAEADISLQGKIAIDTVLQNNQAKYEIRNDLLSAGALMIEPGSVVEFLDNSSLTIREGTLIADGVEFRSASEGGTWRGISLSGSDNSRLENCVVRDAENARNPSDPTRDTFASIYIDGASPTIRNCEITSGNAAPKYGLFITGSSQPLLEKLTLTNSEWGVYSTSDQDFSIKYSHIHSNSIGGVFSSRSTINAIPNNWGHASGPFHAILNPTGLGNQVSDHVLFAPWGTVDDIDGDGLSDEDETNIYGTDPLKSDTDGDGYSDGEEIAAGTDPLDYYSRPTPCELPGGTNDVMLRDTAAEWLGKCVHGATHMPPPYTKVYSDVENGDYYANWIELVFNDQISEGCNSNNTLFCPKDPVTKVQAVKLILRAEHGGSYTPPTAAVTPPYADILLGHPDVDWIDQAKTEGITNGCDDSSNFCPGTVLTQKGFMRMLGEAF